MRRRFFTGKIRTQIFYQKKTCRSNYRQEISSFSHKPPVVQMRRKKTPEWVLGSEFWVLGSRLRQRRTATTTATAVRRFRRLPIGDAPERPACCRQVNRRLRSSCTHCKIRVTLKTLFNVVALLCNSISRSDPNFLLTICCQCQHIKWLQYKHFCLHSISCPQHLRLHRQRK